MAGIALGASRPEVARAADYVIQISVDGLRPSYLQTQINAGLAPNFKRLQDEGGWTHNARTDYTHTITLPNHIAMLTGRPVCSPTGTGCTPVGAQYTLHHGYQSNGDPLPAWTLHNQGNLNIPYKASTFDVAHDAGRSTAHYASKSKFVIFDQSYNATTGAPHANGSDKIDTFFAQENASATMQTQLLAGIAANHFNYTFIHYADPDIAGHGSGWGSTNYMNAIVTVDGYLGQLLNLVENDAMLAGRTAIVLTADHAGTGFDHFTVTLPQIYTIPFYAWGAGVEHGSLYAMNLATRTNPGTSRPSYTAPGQPIRNGDAGNLALDLLGLGAIPGSSINAAQNLAVTLPPDDLPGDFNFDAVVDAADYVVWRKGLGIEYTQGDFNTWRSNFGQTGGGSGGSAFASGPAVPEPSSFAIGCVALAGLYRMRSMRGAVLA
jgi:hypothetical protein